MLNKEAFSALVELGGKKECYIQCRRYGTIQEVHDYSLRDGAHRMVSVTHHGMHFSFHLHNGEVVRMSKK